jgi:nitrogen fixation NifU-like protein
MVTDALRQVMLAADGAGNLVGEGVVTGRSEHPVCGDLVELDLRVANGVIVDFAWRAQGCPAVMAVVAAAQGSLHGRPVEGALLRLRQRVQDLGGLAKTEQHALSIFERAFSKIVKPLS